MKIHSIFKSINGEVCSSHQGSLTVFVRTFGCNCRCSWCDSQFSYNGEAPREMKVREIVREVVKLNTINVTITGGEPLLQKGTPNLIRKLSFHGKKVSIETNGTVFIPLISDSERVKWVVDYKLPSSGYENEDVIYKNFRNLLSHDFVKFVVADRKDFDRAVEVIPLIRNEVSYSFGPKFALSPVWGSLKPETLAQWMIKNEELCKIGAIYSLQIHKILSVK